MNKIKQGLKDALVEAGIFSEDSPTWLEQACLDLIRQLKKRGLEIKPANQGNPDSKIKRKKTG